MNDEPISDCPALQGKVAFPTQKKKKCKKQLYTRQKNSKSEEYGQNNWCCSNAEMCLETRSL